jgi:ribonucleoside-diphosphate reductase alpha chain
LAYKEGLKGITIYRDKSRKKQILDHGKDKEIIYPRELPKVRRGGTWGVETPAGTLHATINEDEQGRPLEAFFNIGKAGGDILAMAEALGRLISLDLRTTSPDFAISKLKLIIEQLSRIGGSSSVGFGPQRVLSLPDGIAKVLKNYLEEKVKGGKTSEERQKSVQPKNPNNQNYGNICPGCGNTTLVYEEGCEKCFYCGYNKC